MNTWQNETDGTVIVDTVFKYNNYGRDRGYNVL